jgi:hypothetical protein
MLLKQDAYQLDRVAGQQITTMGGLTHRFIETNGIRMQVAEQRDGPLVLLYHGFPELWYSWRHSHLLLGGGLRATPANLFPGFGNELMRAGAEPMDPGFDSLYEIPGRDVCPKIKLGWSIYSMTRSLIERMGNIRLRGGCRVLNIVGESNVHHATGIQCEMVNNSREALR